LDLGFELRPVLAEHVESNERRALFSALVFSWAREAVDEDDAALGQPQNGEPSLEVVP
jgi:hypothetical protein